MEENHEDKHFTPNNLHSLPHNYSVDQIKENEMRGISDTNFSRKGRGRGGGGGTLRPRLIENKKYYMRS